VGACCRLGGSSRSFSLSLALGGGMIGIGIKRIWGELVDDVLSLFGYQRP